MKKGSKKGKTSSSNSKKKSKKILMLAPTPFFSDRGCHIRVLNSYLRLKDEGHKITLLTYPIGRDILDIKPIRVRKILGYKKTSPGFSVYRPFLDYLMLKKAKKLMKQENYDLIYAHLHEGALMGIRLRKKFGVPVVFDSQGSLVGELEAGGTIKKKGVGSKIIFPIEKYITKRADEIITSTQGLKDFIKNTFKTELPISVIKDNPDKSLFHPKVKPAKLNLPKNKTIVVYLGGLQKYKGISYLLEAIPHISKDLHFLIMGYPVEEAKELAENLKVADRITFTGMIPYEQAPSYLKLGHIAVSPKTLENKEANAKIYNYMAMSMPIACFDMQETREMLKNYKNKFYLAKQGDVRDLAKGIEKMGEK